MSLSLSEVVSSLSSYGLGVSATSPGEGERDDVNGGREESRSAARHVASRAGSLRRLCDAKSVCTGDREYERAAQLVEAFEKSLSTVRRKLHLVAALFATFSVAYLLARFATPKVDPLSGFFHNQDDVTARFAAEPLREAAAAVLSLKPADAWQALQSLADAHASHSLLHVVLG